MLPRTASLRSLVLALVAGLGLPHAAGAQDAACNQLYAAIQAADDGGRAGQTSRAADRQRIEIDRTQRYSDQLGCQGGGFFGSDPPPTCAAVMDRLQRMEDNLARLEAAAQADPGDRADRQAMVARYNTLCVGAGTPADAAARAGTPYTPTDGQNPADLGRDLFDPDALSAVPPGGDIMDGNGDGGGRTLGQAICVKTCDGGYFPLSPRISEGQVGNLAQLCQASCPNTEAKLYTMSRSGELSSATSADGAPYTDLPTAFQFEKTFTPTCTCKPPGQSWVQALADAETLLGSQDRHDITVTASLSDQMAKPSPAPPLAKGKPGKAGKAPPVPQPDASILHDAEKARQAPTAGTETTGIGGPVRPERMIPQGTGPTLRVKGPDGVSRQIRLIVP